MKKHYKTLAIVIGLILSSALRAEVYQTNEQFLQSSAKGNAVKSQTLWLTKKVALDVEKMLGHSIKNYTQKYWQDGNKTIWILEEIGKEEPITAGFVVSNNKIVSATVLVYRESRGKEIRHPSFLKQYQGVSLLPDQQLNQNIDGISGATLSVRAMGKMARLALYYDVLVKTQP